MSEGSSSSRDVDMGAKKGEEESSGAAAASGECVTTFVICRWTLLRSVCNDLTMDWARHAANTCHWEKKV